MPSGIKSLFVAILENGTSETGVENIITNDLIYEFTRSRKVVLVSRENADAILSGVVTSIRVEAISHRETHTSLERRVKLQVDLKLTDPEGSVIWSAEGISANESYDVMQDKPATEHNKRNAISELSKRLAESVYNRITDNF